MENCNMERCAEWVRAAGDYLAHEGVNFAINLAIAAAMFVVGVLLIRLLSAALEKLISRSKRLDGMISRFVVSVVSKFAWAMLIIMVLKQVGIDVTPLVAGLGVTGFIVGFACQESLANLAAGVMIALNHPFKVGDWIQAGGQEGSVKELNVMATIIATGDNKQIVLPNKVVWGSPIVNFSANPTRRVDMTFGIAYGSSIAKAKEIVASTLAAIPGVLENPPPTIEVKSLDDSAVTLTVRPWVMKADYWPVYFAANQKIKEAFDLGGIEIPFPQLDVHQR